MYLDSEMESSQQAESALRALLEHYLANRYRLEIIDIRENFDAVPNDVLAIPTIIRRAPRPERRVVGNLSAVDKAVAGLELERAKLAIDLPRLRAQQNSGCLLR